MQDVHRDAAARSGARGRRRRGRCRGCRRRRRPRLRTGRRAGRALRRSAPGPSRKARNASMAQGASLSRCRSEANRLWRGDAHFGGGAAGWRRFGRRASAGASVGGRASGRCCAVSPRARARRAGRRRWRRSVMSSIFWMTTACSGASCLNGPIGAGGRDADAIDDFHAFDDLAEHGVTPARGQGIEIGVVGHVQIELAVARVRAAGAREADGAAQILEAIAGFVGDRLSAWAWPCSRGRRRRPGSRSSRSRDGTACWCSSRRFT